MAEARNGAGSSPVLMLCLVQELRPVSQPSSVTSDIVPTRHCFTVCQADRQNERQTDRHSRGQERRNHHRNASAPNLSNWKRSLGLAVGPRLEGLGLMGDPTKSPGVLYCDLCLTALLNLGTTWSTLASNAYGSVIASSSLENLRWREGEEGSVDKTKSSSACGSVTPPSGTNPHHR